MAIKIGDTNICRNIAIEIKGETTVNDCFLFVDTLNIYKKYMLSIIKIKMINKIVADGNSACRCMSLNLSGNLFCSCLNRFHKEVIDFCIVCKLKVRLVSTLPGNFLYFACRFENYLLGRVKFSVFIM